ncbi:nicotinate-nucleotide pyrophosphorylase [Heliothis virescens ascovirus 3g]|uniref:Nicotinate-nucleotide pyrophosphorylase n=2 Tax=Ascovirus hvav3a TaxID=3444724 RepID=K4NW13_9VIRU|nr:nicotinate-nucleotide pyrophosphorylase [Heliothis virescens ascovirus 3g]AFV50358.1 nicotinate-nucleotide pyrophosphorylase [Heliothis virescens ascovirus 3g]AXN77277.1 nicotinate-nucleotide pyrophosphorylase [Heliothis virescens ascovirus 3i]
MIGTKYTPTSFLDYTKFFEKVEPGYRKVYREYVEHNFTDLMRYVRAHHPTVEWPESNEEWYDLLESAMEIGVTNMDPDAIRRAVLGLCCKYNYIMEHDADRKMFHHYMDQPCTLIRGVNVNACIDCGEFTNTLTMCKRVVCGRCYKDPECNYCDRCVIKIYC